MSILLDTGYEEPREASLFDLCEWIVETYPDDIFVTEPKAVIKLREAAEQILALRKEQ